jgi:branched-chain amino acid transport system substrate-binding protein
MAQETPDRWRDRTTNARSTIHWLARWTEGLGMRTLGWSSTRTFIPVVAVALVLAGCSSSKKAAPAASSAPTQAATTSAAAAAGTSSSAAAPAASSAAPVASKGTLKIGALMDLSAVYAFIGTPALAGLQSYVAGVNAAGGINGYKLAVDPQDTRADPVATRTEEKQLQSDGVVAIVGPNDSTTLVPLAPLVTAAKIPDLSLAALTTLHTPSQPYLYATGIRVADHALIAAEWMKAQAAKEGIKSPRVAALTLDTPAVQELRDNLAKAVPAIDGGTLVQNDVVAVTATDMTAAAAPIIASKPDFIQVGLLPSQIPGLITDLRDHGITAPVMNYFVAADDATFKAANDAGYYAVRDYAEPSEQNVPGLTKMKADAALAGKTAAMTSGYFTYGYVSGELIGKAIESCGSTCTGADINTALEKITSFDSQGLAGPVGVNPPTDNLFIKSGRVFSFDASTKTVVPDGDWITAPSLP